MEPVDRREADGNHRMDPKPPEILDVDHHSGRKFGIADLNQLNITMKDLLKWAANRLKEGSTAVGIGMIAAAVGISQELAVEIVSVVVALAGLAGVILKDKPEAEADNG